MVRVWLEGALPGAGNDPVSFKGPMKEVADYMLGSLRENFVQGGRPETWAPLKSGEASFLRQSGRLFQSLAMESGEHWAEAGPADFPFAAILHFGGVINHPGSKKFQAWMSGGEWVFAQGTKAHQIPMPARPYVMFQTEDFDTISAMLARGMLKTFLAPKPIERT